MSGWLVSSEEGRSSSRGMVRTGDDIETRPSCRPTAGRRTDTDVCPIRRSPISCPIKAPHTKTLMFHGMGGSDKGHNKGRNM